MKYGFKSSSRINLGKDAAAHLIQLVETKQAVTSDDVLRDASRKDSPIHNYFDWDDSIAAKKWRIKQAGDLLRAVVMIEDDGKQKPLRAFASVIENGENRTYVSMVRALSDTELRRQVLEQALREIEGWQERYERYREFSGIFRAVKAARKQIMKPFRKAKRKKKNGEA